MIEMDVVNVGMLAGSSNIVLVLREKDGERLLIMEIGPLEANAIAMALEEVRPPRPLTHDLFSTVLGELDARIDSVTIVDFKDSTFFGQLNLDSPAGPLSLDARPSDCVALALRGGAPVYVQPDVLDRAGIVPAGDVEVEDDGEDEEDADDDGGTVH
ncbi:MAG: bifunctional nuclease family protein [Bacillota bacterium]